MDSRNDLSFRGTPAKLEEFLDRLTVSDGAWRFDGLPDAARQLAGRRPLPGKRFCHQQPGSVPDVRLTLAPRSTREWEVTSVVPLGGSGAVLSTADENHVLADFAAHVAPHARDTGVVVVGPGVRPIDLAEYTSPEAAALAEEFRTSAGPAGFTREDFARWQAFALQAYRDALPPRDVIRDWLAQYGWDGGRVGVFADRYDEAIRLLTEYDKATARR